MLSYHSGLRKTLRWYKKAWEHNLEMLFTNAFYYYRCSTLTEISLTWSTSKKISSNVQLAKERRKLSWKQLQAFTTLHQSQKERKLKIQHEDVNKERVTLHLQILRRRPSPLHSSMLLSLSSRHWGTKASRASHH